MNYMLDRKLQRIYDDLDYGRNKQVIQYTDGLLKQNPGFSLFKTLKALAHARNGDEDIAIRLCDEVKDTAPTDTATLHALTLTYEELGQHASIVQVYENVTKKLPKNEKFMDRWFMAMVQSNNFQGQQQAALKLHRTFKKTEYMLWMIMAMALQGKKGNPLSYVLAERSIQTAHQNNNLEKVEHLRLYLLILLEQKKQKEALALMKSPLGLNALRDPEVRQINMELLLENEQWSEAMELSKAALVNENSDDWISWLSYFTAMERFASTNGLDASSQDAYTLVNELKEAVLHTPILKRGPFLAELELNYRLSKLRETDEKLILAGIVSYFERFGSKSCCPEDLQTYITFLRGNVEKAKAFITTLQDSIQDTNDKHGRIKNVYKNVNIRKMERFLDLHPSSDLQQGLGLVNALWKAYQEALPLGVGLEKTEYQYGDDFVLLASHALVDLYHAQKRTVLLVQAVEMLETALLKSAYNFQIKLTLVRLYAMLGISSRPFDIYFTMDIKQIQFDTMIHYFTDRFVSLGCHDKLKAIITNSFAIYKSNEIETPQMLQKAYRFGTFSKIPEFIEFRSRLDTSLQHSISKVELARINANGQFSKSGVQYFRELKLSDFPCDDVFIHERSDNRDFKVFMNCNSEDKPKAIDRLKPMTSTNTTWLHLFSFILNTLASACKNKKAADLGTLAEQFEKFLQQDIHDQISVLEYELASFVCHFAAALVLAKDPETNASQIAEKLEMVANTMSHKISPANKSSLAEACSADSAETALQWRLFHEITTVLEAYDYGTALMEILKGELGKGADLSALQNSSKEALMASQAKIKQARTIYKDHMPKQFLKDANELNVVMEDFKPKENQKALEQRLKIMMKSWCEALDSLEAKVNRRLK